MGLEAVILGSMVVETYRLAVASSAEGDDLVAVAWWQYRCPLLTQASRQSSLICLEFLVFEVSDWHLRAQEVWHSPFPSS